MNKPSRRRLLLPLAVLAIGVALTPAYLRAYTVSGPSDAPTLLLGDQVIVNLAAYDVRLPYSDLRLWSRAEPRRGDMVIFDVPVRGIRGFKRVVAVGGDTVALRDNVVLINGRELAQEPLDRARFAPWVTARHSLGERVVMEGGAYTITFTPGRSPVHTIAPIAVPPNHYFLLGDHRDDSYDSRVFGLVARQYIRGRLVAHWRTNRPAEMWPAW